MSEIEKVEILTYKLKSKRAIELAELNLTVEELKIAQKSLSASFPMLALKIRDAEQEHILGALYRDAVLRLITCFDNGKFSLPADEIIEGRGDIVTYLEYLRNIRTSWIAHSFGPHRQSEVGVVIDPSGNFVGVAPMLVLFQHPEEPEYKQLAMLINRVLKWAVKRQDELFELLIQECSNMRAEELQQLEQMSIKIAGSDQMGKSRAQYRTGGSNRSTKSSRPKIED